MRSTITNLFLEDRKSSVEYRERRHRRLQQQQQHDVGGCSSKRWRSCRIRDHDSMSYITVHESADSPPTLDKSVAVINDVCPAFSQSNSSAPSSPLSLPCKRQWFASHVMSPTLPGVHCAVLGRSGGISAMSQRCRLAAATDAPLASTSRDICRRMWQLE